MPRAVRWETIIRTSSDDSPKIADYRALLVRLAEHEVDFVVVGGVAAVLNGIPIFTADVDVVYSRTSENIQRILRAFEGLDVRYRDPAGRLFVPDEKKLRTFRINLLLTRLGPLDLIRDVADGLEYEDLVQRSNVQEIEGHEIRVLDLETLIEAKRTADRPRDRDFLRQVERLTDLETESTK